MPPLERQTPFKIDLNSVQDPKVINQQLPRIMPSGERMVRKMLRDPYRGKTGFVYQGKTVYHSSAGSSRKSKAGTLFWIVKEDAIYIIAIGQHGGTNRKTYKILWKAKGVEAPDYVVLGSLNSRIG